MIKEYEGNFKNNYDIDDLIKIVAILRGPNGCPWDKIQTHQTVRDGIIEEAYEAADAIDNQDAVSLKEELGDLLLQLVFHSQIGQEAGEFNFSDICDGVCRKLISRHPHVFAGAKANNAQEVTDSWDKLKRQEKGQTSVTQTLISVPKAMPALMRAGKVQSRAAKAAEPIDIKCAVDKLGDSFDQLKHAAGQNDSDLSENIGDVLFSAVNVSRISKVNAENALAKSTDQFIENFSKSEA